MSERYYYITPNDTAIIGSLERLSGRANITCFDADGTPDYEGYTEVFWDGQVTLTRKGKPIYLDREGNEWTLDQCKRLTEDEFQVWEKGEAA